VVPFAGEYRQRRVQDALAGVDPGHEETRC
jgi:hypothetical protein